jgi:hypothetical protein
MIINIKNQKDIEEVLKYVSWLNRPNVDKLILSLPWLSKKQQSKYEKRLKFLFNDCGCLWGGPAFLITFSILFFSKLTTHGISLNFLWKPFLIGIIAAFLGKFLGLRWSYWRIKRYFNEILILKKDKKNK